MFPGPRSTPRIRIVRSPQVTDPSMVDPVVSALAVVAVVLAIGLHRGLVQLIAIMATLGIAVKLLLGG